MTATTSSSPARPHPVMFAASVCAFVAYFVLLHVLIVSRAMPKLSLALVIAPWIVAIASWPLRPVAASATAKRAMRASLALIVVTIVGIAGWRFGDSLAAHAELGLYIENVAFLCALSALFAISMRTGREALVTRLARVARNGHMPPRVVGYTRTVTVAWSIFFAVAAMVSTLLYFTQSRTVWSAFTNLATWPLVGAMFAIEYAIRLRVLRDVPHVSLMTGVRAFRRHGHLDAEGRSS